MVYTLYSQSFRDLHSPDIRGVRMGIHVAPLRIETGRYERLEGEGRVCFNCCNAVASQEQFLLDCHLYQDLREIWFTYQTSV